MNSSEKALLGALRQYKHNDAREELIFGYDHKLANEAVDELQQEIAALKVQNERLVYCLSSGVDLLTDEEILNFKQKAIEALTENIAQSLAAHDKSIILDMLEGVQWELNDLIKGDSIRNYANELEDE